MGAKIPRGIRIEVIRKWLQGKTRDWIANEVCIGAGTVSSIIKEYKRDDPDADLLRETALWIKNEGMDINTFAPLVRLRELLKQNEWILGATSRHGGQEEDEWLDQEAEKKMESLILVLEAFCFKRNLSAKEFFDSIYKMYMAAQKLGIPIGEFPDCVQELEDKVETLTADNCVTKKKLDELKPPVAKVRKEATKYAMDLGIKRLEEEFFWSIDEEELEKINEDFGYGSEEVIKPSNLKEMLMDVYHHPSKYGDIVGKLMERSTNYGYLPLSSSFRRWLSRKR